MAHPRLNGRSEVIKSLLSLKLDFIFAFYTADAVCPFTIYYGLKVEIRYPSEECRYSFRTGLTQIGALTTRDPNDPESSRHQDILLQLDQVTESDGGNEFSRVVATNPLHSHHFFLERIETG